MRDKNKFDQLKNIKEETEIQKENIKTLKEELSGKNEQIETLKFKIGLLTNLNC